jgi:outer membrane protein TolC
LIWLAVEHSPYVQAVVIAPQIQEARAAALLGEFDPTTFVDSIVRDTSEPVGNTLITGSANRLNDHVWDNTAGIRDKNQRGGVTQLSQGVNLKDSNSDFFIPGDQANTKMLLRYTQPLMRNGGTAYNRSSYLIATVEAAQSMQEASAAIQDHALTITTAYWELYAAYAYRAQIERGIRSLESLRNQLAGRSDLDSLESQLLRANAEISRQRADQAQARSQINSAQANLRANVAAPALRGRGGIAIFPATPTSDWYGHYSLENELSIALSYHPEIQSLRDALRASRIRLQVAEQDLRPTLDLVLEGYLNGLNGDFNAIRSFGDQFSVGAPSYSAGLSFARPYRNRTATAILRERRLELQRDLLKLDHTLLIVGAEVESALARVNAAFQQLESAVQSTLSTHAEREYLMARWQNAFLDGTQTSLLLDQLLNAEIQLISAEHAWARAQADHMIAIAQLSRATGALVPMLGL